MDWRTHLRRRTGEPGFLWAMVFAILLAGMVGGGIASRLPKSTDIDDNSIRGAVMAGWDHAATGESLDRLLDPATPFDFTLVAIAHVDVDDDSLRRISERWQDASPQRGPAHVKIARDLVRSLIADQPVDDLVRMAGADPPVRHANAALGAFALAQRDFAAAARRFEIEGSFDDAELARRFALESYAAADDSDTLVRLADEPDYQNLISSYDRLVVAQSRRDWKTILVSICQLVLDRVDVSFATGLALLAGLGWFGLAIQMGQPGTSAGVRPWLCVVAVLLGGLSIPVTHLIDVWQELDWGIRESDDMIEGIKYYVLGVGFREEFAKTLLLLPLIPFLVRRRSSREALIVSACVGLGFAIVENMGYFARSGGTDSMGRFLTANFAHMAMTGLIGLALARTFWGDQDISHGLLAFLLVVLVHGFYDATIAVIQLADYSLLGTMIFILLAYAFFREVRDGYVQRPETIHLTAAFLFVVTSLTAITFAYVSWQVGWAAAIVLLVADLLSLGVMVYMYLREMPNSLVR